MNRDNNHGEMHGAAGANGHKSVDDNKSAVRKADSGTHTARGRINSQPVRSRAGQMSEDGADKPANPASTVSAKHTKQWERVQAQLKTKLGAEAYASWFSRCRLETVSKGQLTLSVPTIFLKSWIKSHYSTILMELWKGQLEDLLRIDIVLRSAVRSENGENGAQKQPVNRAVPRPGELPQGETRLTGSPRPVSDVGGNFTPLPPKANPFSAGGRGSGVFGSPLDPSFTFATFVEGPSNRVACAAARSVAEADGSAARFNPLLIHAGVGLGKTHLLQAIAWAANARSKGVKILYLTAEYFMWRFASAIRDKTALSFKESLRDIDLLLIDDMQFLQGQSIQQEFCHLLNALIDSAKQVVIAADRPPSELESLDDRVKSRLRGGVALEVNRPDLEMRQSILNLRYEEARKEDPQLEIPGDILNFVATKVASSGRDIEGAFNQLLVQHRFSDGPLDADAISRMLSHLVLSGEQKRVRIEDIQKVVARHYDVSKNDLLSNRRTRVIVRPRQIAMYLAKQMTPRSLPEIGRRFGGRDHTTVLHAVRKIGELKGEDPKLAHEIELLQRLIEDQG